MCTRAPQGLQTLESTRFLAIELQIGTKQNRPAGRANAGSQLRRGSFNRTAVSVGFESLDRTKLIKGVKAIECMERMVAAPVTERQVREAARYFGSAGASRQGLKTLCIARIETTLDTRAPRPVIGRCELNADFCRESYPGGHWSLQAGAGRICGSMRGSGNVNISDFRS